MCEPMRNHAAKRQREPSEDSSPDPWWLLARRPPSRQGERRHAETGHRARSHHKPFDRAECNRADSEWWSAEGSRDECAIPPCQAPAQHAPT